MLETVKTYLRHTSWPIILAMVTLIVIGVSAIRVAEPELARTQMAFAGVAMAVFVVMTLVPYQRLGRWAYPICALSLGLLVLVFFLPDNKGSHRWIDLRVAKFQPSELAKIAYVIMLAWYLRFGDHYRRLIGLAVPFVLTLIPMMLVLKEPDLGTALLFLPTLYFMLFMAGARLRHLLGIVAMGTVLIFVPVPQHARSHAEAVEAQTREALAYWTHTDAAGEKVNWTAASLAAMEWHQIKRIDGWLRQNDPGVMRNRAYQVSLSKLRLGLGGWAGQGADPDSGGRFKMPEDHTDFIFSVVGGEWGFLGAAAVLMLYGIIFLFGLEIATGTDDPFGRLLAVGVLALLFSQVTINIGVTMGLMPVTGMTLPFVSYGGSSLVVNCMALGLLVNVGQNDTISLARRPFEHSD